MNRTKQDLPPRAALTIPELLERWGCTETHLRELIVQGALVASIHIDARGKPEHSLPAAMTPEPTFAGHGAEPTLHLHGLFYLVRPFAAGPHDCTFWYVSRERSPDTGDRLDEDGDWCPATDNSPARPKKTRPTVAYSVLREEHGMAAGSPISFSLNEVLDAGVVVLAEIERFERVSGDKQVNQAAAHEFSAQKTLQLLGVLLEYLVRKDRSTVPTSPNQGALSETLAERADVRGLGKSNIDRLFAEANAALNSARKATPGR